MEAAAQIVSNNAKIKTERKAISAQFWYPIVHIFVKYSAGYIVIIGLIILLIYLFRKSRQPAPRPTLNVGPRTSDKQSTSSKLRPRNPYANVDHYAVDRPLVGAGRVDQVVYYDPTDRFNGSNYNSIVKHSIPPEKIVWRLDPTQTEDYEMLPQRIMDEFRSQDLEIEIPWKSDGVYMRPDCGNAQFKDGKSAASILKDTGATCVLQSGKSSLYTNARRTVNTNRGYKGLDVFSTQSSPNCYPTGW